mmetsp:Transcript_88873/g.157446  ORF Transcript_88873/g.157446 Transcript_88873/m.157446 type:complete len:150 (-) Transcript_88873:38-487(-)
MAYRACCRHARLLQRSACPFPCHSRLQWLGALRSFTVHSQIKATADAQVIDISKNVGDFCKRGEVIASLYVQLDDERGGVHGDEEELNMDGCEGLVAHYKELKLKATVAGEVVQVLDDDVREVEAGEVVAVIEAMSKSTWAARNGVSDR